MKKYRILIGLIVFFVLAAISVTVIAALNSAESDKIQNETRPETKLISPSKISDIEQMDLDYESKERLKAIASKLVEGSWYVDGRYIIDLPITDTSAFPEYYDTDVFSRFNTGTAGAAIKFVYNTLTGNTLVYMTDKDGNTRGVSSAFMMLQGVERCFFDRNGHLVLFTVAARGYKELRIIDFDSGNARLDNSGMVFTALYYNGKELFMSDRSRVYDENGGLIAELVLKEGEYITSFAVSDEREDIVCFTNEYRFLTFTRSGEVYKEVFCNSDNGMYRDYKRLVLTGDYFHANETDDYKNACPFGYIEGGCVHCYCGLNDGILKEETPHGFIYIDIMTGKVDLSGLSPEIHKMSEQFSNPLA